MPLNEAPSNVAGKPVFVQSPAKKIPLYDIEVRKRSNSKVGVDRKVAFFSLITTLCSKFDVVIEGNIEESSLYIVSTSCSFVNVIVSSLALITIESRDFANEDVVGSILYLLKTHCDKVPINPKKGSSISVKTSLSNQRYTEVIGELASLIFTFMFNCSKSFFEVESGVAKTTDFE